MCLNIVYLSKESLKKTYRLFGTNSFENGNSNSIRVEFFVIFLATKYIISF